MRSVFLGLLVVLGVTACGAAQPPPPAKKQSVLASIASVEAPPPAPKPAPPRADPTLLARNVLFSNPDRAWPTLSPDGKRIAYLSSVEGVLNVWVAPASDLAKAKPVTQDKKRGIRI